MPKEVGKEIGILALQGGFQKHFDKLTTIGATPILVRYAEELERCEGLIIPGGESTTISSLLDEEDLRNAVRKFAMNKPILATCAGMILLSKEGLLDIKVARNGYGKQSQSFSTLLSLHLDGGVKEIEALFIRAPRIKSINSPEIEVIACFHNEPVFIRKKNLWALAFHPELTDDLFIHQAFYNEVKR